MTKKFWAAVLALVLVLTMSIPALAWEPVAATDIKIGYILIGDKTDNGYSQQHVEAMQRTCTELGINHDTQVLYKEFVPEADCEGPIRELIQDGCNIIFTNSFGFGATTKELAEEFPEVIFAHATGVDTPADNFATYCGAFYQARYLTGIAAGLKTKTNKIGYVAAMFIAETVGGINAFTLGVKSVNPEATVYVKNVNTWYDLAVEKAAAEALLSEGCDVLCQHVDSPATQQAAEAAGAFGCGYNSDMTKNAPKAHLTAALCNWDTMLTPMVKMVLEGNWEAKAWYGGLADNTVTISPLSENCAEGTADAIEAARQGIIDGTLDIFAGPLNDNAGNVMVKEGETLTPEFISFQMSDFVEGVVVE